MRSATGPIVVGGTGLYLCALTEELSPIPSVPDEIRRATVELHEILGGEAFLAELTHWDRSWRSASRPATSSG